MARKESPAARLARKNRKRPTLLRDMRTEHGLTLTEVAKALRISVSHYQRIEAGDCTPAKEVAWRIAVFFNSSARPVAVRDLWPTLAAAAK